jgi:flagellin
MLNSNAALDTAFERLSTGKRINSAVDDAAGLAIGKDLESRVSGLNQAIRNVNDGISMVQIAEGAMDEVTTILQRMRDLAVQASNGSLSTTERGFLDTEHAKLAESLGKALDQAKFNSVDLVSDVDQNLVIQSGADAGDTTTLAFSKMSESELGVSASNIDLTGSASVSSTVSFEKFEGKASIVEVQDSAGIDAKLASGGTGTYSVNIDGTVFTTSTISAPTTVMELATALNNATNATAGAATNAGEFTASGTKLTFTAGAGGAIASTKINASGFTNAFNSGGELTMADVTAGAGITHAAGDYKLTVGTKEFTFASAAGTVNNKAVATGLQAAITAQGITEFSIATKGGMTNSAIELTYAGSTTDNASTVYKLENTNADVEVDGTSGKEASVVTGDGASGAITAIDAALARVASERATLGATQGQLESTVRNLANVAENTAAAAGRIMDTDYAAETANLTKAQILQQAATSILAQANARPQAVLALLQ